MKKPKRDNLKYLAISFFRDYEFVECIAFEMAIRNKENFQALKDVIAHKYSDFEYNYHFSELEDKSEVSESFRKKYMETYHISNDKDMDRIIKHAKNIKLLQDNGIHMDNIYKFFHHENIEKCLNYFTKTQHFTATPHKISSLLTTVNVEKYVPADVFDMHTKHGKLHMDKQHDKLFKDNDEILKEYGLTSLSTKHLNSQKCPNIECFKDHERTEIHFKYQRPKLQFKTNLNALINLNLALPIAELEYQLKILKMKLNNLNLHTDINSSALKEIAGEDYFAEDHLKKHNRNDTYADLFFTYDYYNYMLPVINRCNNIKKVKHNREIKKIKQRNDLDRYDKKNKIQEETDAYKRSKLLKPDILMEIEKQVKLFPVLHSLKKELHDKEITNEEFRTEKERIVQEYLFDKVKPSEKPLEYMQKMIDKLQYKEFITGIKNPPKNT